MKPDAFDNDIKKILDEATYKPSEASWQKLEAALKHSAAESLKSPVALPSKRRTFLPATWAAAAALVGVVFVSGYLLYSGDEKAAEHIAAQPVESAKTENQSAKITQNTAANEASTTVEETIAGTIAVAKSSNANIYLSGKSSNNNTINKHFATSTTHAAVAKNEGMSIKPPIASFNLEMAALSHLPSNVVGMSSINPYQMVPASTLSVASKKQQLDDDNSGGFYTADWSSDDMEKMTVFEDPFVYGASVKAALPTVGPMQFNAGLTINKDIGKKFFTESTIDLSYTDVRFDKALYYKENENGSVMNLGNGDHQDLNSIQEKATGQTTTTYRNNVLGVGLATVFGAKLNKSVTVAVGADMYRNFNNDLILKDNPMVTETSLKGSVAPLKWISLWDAGARAQVGVKLTKHIGLVGQYRKGLVNYMMDASGSVIKNSSVSLGLNVKFNP